MSSAATPAAGPAPTAARDVVLVALGGALGAVLRHVTARAVLLLPGAGALWAITVVNLTGALLLGVVVARGPSSPQMLFWGTGVLGAYTTFSALAVEGADRPVLVGLAQMVGMLVVGVVAARTGHRLVDRGAGAR